MGKSKSQYTLVVEYKGGLDKTKDALITRLVGREESGSGFCFCDGSRDLAFDFVTRRGAENAMKRVRTSRKRVRCFILRDDE